MNERELIEKAQKGDRQSFAQLYDAYISRIYDFIYYKTHHKETAQDLTSDTFLRALKSIGQFDPSRAFGAWVYKIAQNAVIDHYRKMARHPSAEIDDAWDVESDEDVEFDSDTRIQVKQLRELMKTLKPIQRDILMMRVWQEMPYKEIAAIVGKTEDNCKTIYSRTLSELRERFPGASVLALLALAFNVYISI